MVSADGSTSFEPVFRHLQCKDSQNRSLESDDARPVSFRLFTAEFARHFLFVTDKPHACPSEFTEHFIGLRFQVFSKDTDIILSRLVFHTPETVSLDIIRLQEYSVKK